MVDRLAGRTFEAKPLIAADSRPAKTKLAVAFATKGIYRANLTCQLTCGVVVLVIVVVVVALEGSRLNICRSGG